MDRCRENYKIIRDASIFIIIFVLILWIITLTCEVSSAMILISIKSSMRPEMDYLLIPRVVPDLNEHIALWYRVWMTFRIVSVRSDPTMAFLIVLKCWCYYPSLLMKWSNSCVCTQKFGSWIVRPVSLHHWYYKYWKMTEENKFPPPLSEIKGTLGINPNILDREKRGRVNIS